jgi:protein tyrosine/serine phosphatase
MPDLRQAALVRAESLCWAVDGGSMKYIALVTLLTFCQASFADLEFQQIPQLHEVNELLLRGGRPTKQDYLDLRNQGVQLVINLENDKKQMKNEEKWSQELGFHYFPAPMSAFSTPNDKLVDQVLALLQQGQEKIFLHCKHGEDRTGMIIGLYRVLVQGWSAKDAYQEMLDRGFHESLTPLKNYFWKRVERGRW